MKASLIPLVFISILGLAACDRTRTDCARLSDDLCSPTNPAAGLSTDKVPAG
ncbi:hypothetical protein LSUCC0031_05945 [Rhodobacterales bacterium LSUCC0031]|nr:hypothetical protein [Rhodobacterales bacterium LSUCC0031]